jgi:hypothetical protein
LGRSAAARLKEGDKVEANYKGRGKYFSGRIRRDREDGTYDVDYDDGEAEQRVKEEWIRLIVSGVENAGKPSVVAVDNGEMRLADVCKAFVRNRGGKVSRSDYVDFGSMLSFGQSPVVAKAVRRIIDVFDELDARADGFVSVRDLDRLLEAGGVSRLAWQHLVAEFRDYASASYREDVFRISDFFYFFGNVVEAADGPVLSLTEVLSKFRLEASISVAHDACRFVQRILKNMLQNANDKKYRTISVEAESFKFHVWRYAAGKELMRTLGFCKPYTLVQGAKMQEVVSWKRSPNAAALTVEEAEQLRTLHSEIDAALSIIEDAPSVQAVVSKCRDVVPVSQLLDGLSLLSKIARNVLKYPMLEKVYVVKRDNALFAERLSGLPQCENLMRAIGFSPRDVEGVRSFVFRSFQPGETSTAIDLHPVDQQFLLQRDGDMQTAIRALELELTAAAPKATSKGTEKKTAQAALKTKVPLKTSGKAAQAERTYTALMSCPDGVKVGAWLDCLATVEGIVDKVVNDGQSKYRKLRKSNHVFHQKVGQHRRGVELLMSAGFRDVEDDTLEFKGGSESVASSLLVQLRAFIKGLTATASPQQVAELSLNARTSGANAVESVTKGQSVAEKADPKRSLAKTESRQLFKSQQPQARGTHPSRTGQPSTAAASATEVEDTKSLVKDLTTEAAKLRLKSSSMERALHHQKGIVHALSKKLQAVDEEKSSTARLVFEVVDSLANGQSTRVADNLAAPVKAASSAEPDRKMTSKAASIEPPAQSRVAALKEKCSPGASSIAVQGLGPVKSGALLYLDDGELSEWRRVVKSQDRVQLDRALDNSHAAGVRVVVCKFSRANIAHFDHMATHSFVRFVVEVDVLGAVFSAIEKQSHNWVDPPRPPGRRSILLQVLAGPGAVNPSVDGSGREDLIMSVTKAFCVGLNKVALTTPASSARPRLTMAVRRGPFVEELKKIDGTLRSFCALQKLWWLIKSGPELLSWDLLLECWSPESPDGRSPFQRYPLLQIMFEAFGAVRPFRSIHDFVQFSHIIDGQPFVTEACLGASQRNFADITFQGLLQARMACVEQLGTITVCGIWAEGGPSSAESNDQIDGWTCPLSGTIVCPNTLDRYTLSDDGVVSAFVDGGRCRLTERVMWAEPLMKDPKESSAAFSVWLQKSDQRDTEEISSQLSSFSAMTLRAVGATKLTVDASSGIIGINCSVTNESLCFVEPVGLCRVFRIKVPEPLHPMLVSATTAIRNGERVSEAVSIDSPLGVVTHFSLCHSRKLLLCTLHKSSSVLVLNSCTGQLLTRLEAGAEVSSMAFSRHDGVCICTTVHCKVLTWKLDWVFDKTNNEDESRFTLLSELRSALGLERKWQYVRVVQLFDESMKPLRDASRAKFCEVILSSGLTRVLEANRQLRDCRESRRPSSTPRWASGTVSVAKGARYALFDFDDAELFQRLAAKFKTVRGPKRMVDMLSAMLKGSVAKESIGAVVLNGKSPGDFFLRLCRDSASERRLGDSLVFTVGVVRSLAMENPAEQVAFDNHGLGYTVPSVDLQVASLVQLPAAMALSPAKATHTLSLRSEYAHHSRRKSVVVKLPLLEEAFRLDLKSASSQAQWKGFVYCFDNGKAVAIQTSRFAPTLVTLTAMGLPDVAAVASASDLVKLADVFYSLRLKTKQVVFLVSSATLNANQIVEAALGGERKGVSKVTFAISVAERVETSLGSFELQRVYSARFLSLAPGSGRFYRADFGERRSCLPANLPLFLHDRAGRVRCRSLERQKFRSSVAGDREDAVRCLLSQTVERANFLAQAKVISPFVSSMVNMISIDRVAFSGALLHMLIGLLLPYSHQVQQRFFESRGFAIANEPLWSPSQSEADTHCVSRGLTLDQRWSGFQSQLTALQKSWSLVSDATRPHSLTLYEWASFLQESENALFFASSAVAQYKQILSRRAQDFYIPPNDFLGRKDETAGTVLADEADTQIQYDLYHVVAVVRHTDYLPGLLSYVYHARPAGTVESTSIDTFMVLKYANAESKRLWRDFVLAMKSIQSKNWEGIPILLPDDNVQFIGENSSTTCVVYRWDPSWITLGQLFSVEEPPSLRQRCMLLSDVSLAVRQLQRLRYHVRFLSTDAVIVSRDRACLLLLPLCSEDSDSMGGSLLSTYCSFLSSRPVSRLFVPTSPGDRWDTWGLRVAALALLTADASVPIDQRVVHLNDSVGAMASAGGFPTSSGFLRSSFSAFASSEGSEVVWASTASLKKLFEDFVANHFLIGRDKKDMSWKWQALVSHVAEHYLREEQKLLARGRRVSDLDTVFRSIAASMDKDAKLVLSSCFRIDRDLPVDEATLKMAIKLRLLGNEFVAYYFYTKLVAMANESDASHFAFPWSREVVSVAAAPSDREISGKRKGIGSWSFVDLLRHFAATLRSCASRPLSPSSWRDLASSLVHTNAMFVRHQQSLCRSRSKLRKPGALDSSLLFFYHARDTIAEAWESIRRAGKKVSEDDGVDFVASKLLNESAVDAWLSVVVSLASFSDGELRVDGPRMVTSSRSHLGGGRGDTRSRYKFHFQSFKAIEKFFNSILDGQLKFFHYPAPVVSERPASWAAARTFGYFRCFLKVLMVINNSFSYWEGKDLSQPVKLLLNLVQSLIPNVSSSGVVKHLMVESGVVEVIKAVVDSDVVSFIAAFFAAGHTANSLLLMDIFARVFSFLRQLDAVLVGQYPFCELGRQFTTSQWLHGLTSILSNVRGGVEQRSKAFFCLDLLSTNKIWTRFWRPLKVLQRLKRYGLSESKRLADHSFSAVPDVLYCRNVLSVDDDRSDPVDAMRLLQEQVQDMKLGFTVEELRAFVSKGKQSLHELDFQRTTASQHQKVTILATMEADLLTLLPRVVFVHFSSPKDPSSLLEDTVQLLEAIRLVLGKQSTQRGESSLPMGDIERSFEYLLSFSSDTKVQAVAHISLGARVGRYLAAFLTANCSKLSYASSLLQSMTSYHLAVLKSFKGLVKRVTAEESGLFLALVDHCLFTSKFLVFSGKLMLELCQDVGIFSLLFKTFVLDTTEARSRSISTVLHKRPLWFYTLSLLASSDIPEEVLPGFLSALTAIVAEDIQTIAAFPHVVREAKDVDEKARLAYMAAKFLHLVSLNASFDFESLLQVRLPFETIQSLALSCLMNLLLCLELRCSVLLAERKVSGWLAGVWGNHSAVDDVADPRSGCSRPSCEC